MGKGKWKVDKQMVFFTFHAMLTVENRKKDWLTDEINSAALKKGILKMRSNVNYAIKQRLNNNLVLNLFIPHFHKLIPKYYNYFQISCMFLQIISKYYNCFWINSHIFTNYSLIL